MEQAYACMNESFDVQKDEEGVFDVDSLPPTHSMLNKTELEHMAKMLIIALTRKLLSYAPAPRPKPLSSSLPICIIHSLGELCMQC